MKFGWRWLSWYCYMTNRKICKIFFSCLTVGFSRVHDLLYFFLAKLTYSFLEYILNPTKIYMLTLLISSTFLDLIDSFKTSIVFIVVELWFRTLMYLEVVLLFVVEACFKEDWLVPGEPNKSSLEKRFSNLWEPKFIMWSNIHKKGGKIQVEKKSYT